MRETVSVFSNKVSFMEKNKNMGDRSPSRGNLEAMAQDVSAFVDELDMVRGNVETEARLLQEQSGDLFCTARQIARVKEKLQNVNAFLAREAAFGHNFS